MWQTQSTLRTFEEVKLLLEKDRMNIKKSLGKGAFGEVFLVERGLMFAVKTISKIQVKRRPFLQKYIRQEMDAMKILKHENIIRQEKIIEHSQYYFLVLQYCEGGNLLNYQAKLKNRIFLLSEALEVMVSILKGLKVIHQNGYIHRDIKSQNVLIKISNNSANGRSFKIADFGFARPIKEGTATTVCGTQKYMAPEILENSPYNISVDIWALGVLLYFMLFAEYPFKSMNLLGDIKRKCSGTGFNMREVVLKKQRLNQCPIQLDDFFRKIFVVDYKKRITFNGIISHPLFREHQHLFIDTRNFYLNYQINSPAIVPESPENFQDDDLFELEDGSRSALMIGEITVDASNKHLSHEIQSLNFQIDRITYIRECSREFYENHRRTLGVSDRLAIRYYLLKAFIFYSGQIIESMDKKEIPKQMSKLKLDKWREFTETKEFAYLSNTIKAQYMLGLQEFDDTYYQLSPIVSQINIKYFCDKFTRSVSDSSFQEFKVSYRSTTSHIFRLMHDNKTMDQHLKNKVKMRLFCCHMINRVFSRSQMQTNFEYYVKWTKHNNCSKYDFSNFKKWILVQSKDNLDKNIRLLNSLFFSK